MDAVLYDLINKKNYQIEKFTASGTFTAKKTGVHFINGCGAGASGGLSQAYSGGAGAGCKMFPVFLTKGESVPVTIGAGGVWVSGGDPAPGGDTSFGSYLTLQGAPGIFGGLNRHNSSGSYVWLADARPAGSLICGASGAFNGTSTPPGWSNYKGGMPSGTTSPFYHGGAGGFYGPGGNGNNAGVGASSAANSGAGGGSGSTGGGNGGSGYLEVIFLS